jgi:hypothetical protein
MNLFSLTMSASIAGFTKGKRSFLWKRKSEFSHHPGDEV